MIEFRNWVHNLWVDNCEERMLYCDGDRLTEQEYFQRFKWWLRREYQHQINRQKEQDERRKQFEQWTR
jgi:hypothetical protein